MPSYPREDKCDVCGKHVGTILNRSGEIFALGKCDEHADKTWDLFWSPEGRRIATVDAPDARAAVNKAPKKYRRYLGEIYAVEVKTGN